MQGSLQTWHRWKWYSVLVLVAVVFSVVFFRIPAWAMFSEDEEEEEEFQVPPPVESAALPKSSLSSIPTTSVAKPAAAVSSSSAGQQKLTSQRVGSSGSDMKLRKSWYWYLRGKGKSP